jgi:hypothetical protein
MENDLQFKVALPKTWVMGNSKSEREASSHAPLESLLFNYRILT